MAERKKPSLFTWLVLFGILWFALDLGVALVTVVTVAIYIWMQLIP